jgi:mono/diheme cytochrome c family protein
MCRRTVIATAALVTALGLASACSPQGSADAPAPATAAPATAAVVTAPPVAAVGPDGPPSIVVPADLAATVAAGDPAKGEALFSSKGCVACHKVDATRLVGPGLAGVTQRRSLPWVARMILKPEQMVKDDPEAKKLFATYMTPMANQSVDPVAELPHLIAFLKTKH